jgi:CheY-like chemotaxis protein
MSSQPPRIVVVEDNPADVALLRRALEEQGQHFELIVLSDGEQAVQFVDKQRLGNEAVPCVILLDLHLPRVDGTTVLEAISNTPPLDHVKVAVWTTLASPTEHADALRLGADLYTLKPNAVEGFWEMAEVLLEMCNSHALGTTTV